MLLTQSVKTTVTKTSKQTKPAVSDTEEQNTQLM